MSIYIDNPKFVKWNKSWPWGEACNMVADTEEELHERAEALGLKRNWHKTKPFSHYLLSPKKRELCNLMGAQVKSDKDLSIYIRTRRIWPIISITHLRVAGVSFRKEAVKKIQLTNPVIFMPEPDNTFDPHAIAVYCEVDRFPLQIGYAPKECCLHLKRAFQLPAYVGCMINAIGKPKPMAPLGVQLSLFFVGKPPRIYPNRCPMEDLPKSCSVEFQKDLAAAEDKVVKHFEEYTAQKERVSN